MTDTLTGPVNGHATPKGDLLKPTAPEAEAVVIEPPAPWQPKPRRGALRTVRAVATHERTRTTGRLAVRHSMYLVGGTRIVTRRAWDGRTAARYERMMRTAEAAGQLEDAKEWEERGRQFRAARHQRRMDLLTAPQRIAKGAAFGVGVTAGGLLALGGVLAIANEDVSQVLAPTMAVIETVRWLSWLVAVVWGPAVALAPWLALLAVWGVGRH